MPSDSGPLDQTRRLGPNGSGSGLSEADPSQIANSGEINFLEPIPDVILPSPGEMVGRFELLEQVGLGGVGVVFRAVDLADGSIVAIKMLRAALPSEEARRRFIKETRMLKSLDSPFITRLIEADTQADRCFMAVEFVDGPNVATLARNARQLPENEALAYLADAARGIAVAHAMGIIHRDIKPENLLVCPANAEGRRRIKVTDFGLARSIVQNQSMELTGNGMVVGTPFYMAPEQFRTGPIDPRADVYGLGATLYHLLAGRPPFPADDLMVLARAVVSEPAPPLERENSAVSGATAALVARCLAKKPDDRPPDAAAFLREIELILGGQTFGLTSHPKLPAGSGRIRQDVFVWELKLPPSRLWPYISNTERFNRAIGLPPAVYEIRHDPQLGVRRFASARVIGFDMRWEEHPYEWIEGRRMGILRVIEGGPFAWLASVVELLPGPSGGTTLRHTLQAEPRGIFGRLIAPLEFGIKARRHFSKVYQRLDDILSAAGTNPTEVDPFEGPIKLSSARKTRLSQGLQRLLDHGIDNETASVLVRYLTNASDQDVSRIRPLALAKQAGVNGMVLAETCLRAVIEGLLELHWDIICPLCRISTGRRNSLQDLKEHEHCLACNQDFRTDFASGVEMVFQAHPDIRYTDNRTYCAGGPAHSPHVVAQVRMAAGEFLELELNLSEGRYRLRGPQMPWSIDLRIESSAIIRRWPINLNANEQKQLPSLGVGGQVLELVNDRPYELLFRVERTADRDDALTAARATALASFRTLFPGQLLSAGYLAPAATTTLLMVEIDGGENLYDELGEAQTFRLLQVTFGAIEDYVRAEGGAVIKTIGEGLLIAFTDLSSGVRTALNLASVIATQKNTANIRLKIALHRGLTMVATVNDRLDYFGHTVNFTSRLLKEAKSGELLVSAAITDDREAAALLKSRHFKTIEIARPGRSAIIAYRLETTSAWKNSN